VYLICPSKPVAKQFDEVKKKSQVLVNYSFELCLVRVCKYVLDKIFSWRFNSVSIGSP